MKAKTPEQLAKKDSVKDKFTLYLNVKNMSEVKRIGVKNDIGASPIVDEAIAFYLAHIKDK